MTGEGRVGCGIGAVRVATAVTECTLLHGTIHLFDDETSWGPGVNTWMFPNESFLGWLGSLISDRAHPIANLMNMHRAFRALV